MTAPPAPVVTAVVVTWNSASSLPGTLDSLADHGPSVPYDVVVVDNASADDSAGLAERHRLRPRVVRNPRNVGLAAGNNQGFALSTAEFLLVCNPDIVLRPGAVDALLDGARRHPRAAFVLARLVYPDGVLQTGVGDLPTFREAYLGRRAARLRREDSGFWWDGWPHDEERQVGHGEEACYLVRRAAVDEVGVQDPGYVLDWEGFDWAARMADAGWEVWFTPQAEVVHLGGVSIRQAQARWIVSSHRGMHRYFAARSPRVVRPLLALAVAARCLVKLALLARPDRVYDRAHRVDPA